MRRLTPTLLGLVGGLLLSGEAAAQGTLAGGALTPIEQRVALALGPARTTLWTQVRVDVAAGPVAIVVPAAVGAQLDWSSPAWLEALELATAPRIAPPNSVVPACPGEVPPADPIEVLGQQTHVPPLEPLEVAVLADADAVASWALGHGLSVPATVYAAMTALGAERFVVARFDAPSGVSLTPTLRMTGPAPAPTLPLVLSEATGQDLLVSAFTLAEGRAAFADGPAASLPAGLSYDAALGISNYDALRRSALIAAGAQASLLECASRTALADDLSLSPSHVVESALATYFTRAAAYGDGFDPMTCIAGVDTLIDSPTPVAASCPRADLGTVETGSCSESPAVGELDPALLRCGTVADDLAVGLSGMVASDVWLTRHSLLVPAGQTGALRQVTAPGGSTLHPAHTAESLDLSGCDEGGGGMGGSGGMGAGGSGGTGGGGSGGAPTGGAAPVREVPVYRVDTSCGADQVFPTPLFFIEIDDSDTVDAYYVEEDCGGDTTGAYQPVYEDETVSDGVEDDILDDAESDGCSGNATDSYVDSSGEPIDESDGCSGDTTSDSSVVETGDTSSESYGEADCGGDTTGDSGSSSSDSDCGGDTTTSDSGSSDTSCGGDSGDSSDSCSLSRPRRVRPRFSVLVMGLLGLVAPLRRLTRPKRKKR